MQLSKKLPDIKRGSCGKNLVSHLSNVHAYTHIQYAHINTCLGV